MKKLIIATLCVVSSFASAADIEWSGLYRIEGISIHKPDLATASRGMDYGLHHLILRPKIVAGDGFTIRSQFEIFNSSAYPNSHMGQIFGAGVRGTNQSIAGSKDESNVFSNNARGGTVKVSHLYLTYDHEYGSLLVGRAPLQFGLGVTYNAGTGLFDHFYDAMDMVGYKFVFGNLYLLPMWAKANSGAPNRNDDVNAYMVQLQYDMPESDSELGVFFQLRKAGDQGSDAPIAATDSIGGTGATINSGVGIQTISFYALKDVPKWRVGFEGSFQGGQSGVRTAGGERVTMGGFGLAAEVEYRPQDSDFRYGFKAGFATGDNPNTDNKYEGYLFNRNYNVAFLMFNHPLGQYDVFRTRMVGGGGGQVGTANEISQTDVDTVSNAFYFAPYATYRMSDRWSMKGVLATGYLNVDPMRDGGTKTHPVSRDIGFEFDYALNFSPRKGVMWINEIGLLFPGGAFKGGGDGPNSFPNGFTYGFQTKAAISF